MSGSTNPDLATSLPIVIQQRRQAPVSCCVHHSTKRKERQFYQNYRSFVADRVGFEPTSLLRDYLISSVVPRTDFSGSWAKIAPRIGSPGEPSKPLISRQLKPQSRMASRKIRTHRVSPQNGLQTRKKERIWGERRENGRERKPCFHSKF